MKTNHSLSRTFLCCLLFLCASVTFSQTRYLDDIFGNVNETQNVIFSTNVPQPLPSDPINFFFVNIPGNANVPEHLTEGRDLRMNIYQPDGDTNSTRPVIIFCFGGGFTGGNRFAPDMKDLAVGMAKKGFVTATIDYRTGINLFDEGASKRAVYRAVQDSRAAIRLFRNDAASNNTYRINPEQVYIAGYSAGGFVALHNIYLDRDADRPESSRASSYSYSQNTFFGFSNFAMSDLGCLDCAGTNTNFSGKANAAVSISGAVGELSYIEGSNDVPALLFHSSDDNTVPYNVGVPYGAGSTRLSRVFGSNAIKEDATRKGASVRLKSYNNRGHVPHITGNGDLYPEIIPEIADFLFDVINGVIINPDPAPTPPISSDIPVDQIISLRKTGGDRKYVTAERFDNDSQVLARANTVQAWETFRVEAHPQGGIALKALSNDKYLQVNGTNQNAPIKAKGDQKLGWEQFNWLVKGPGEVALQSAFTNRWVQAAWTDDNAVLYPRGQEALGWETFEWAIVAASKEQPTIQPTTTAQLATEVYPNPVGRNGEIYINTSLKKVGDVHVQLFDTAGREIYQNSYNNLNQGGLTITLNTTAIGSFSGVYLLKITKDQRSEVIKIIF